MRAMRERLGIPEGRRSLDGMISLAKAAERLKICVGSTGDPAGDPADPGLDLVRPERCA